jgi:hypothetical protein
MMMKLTNTLIPAITTCSMLVAQPAWAQSTPPASASAEATASIEDNQLSLGVTALTLLDFRRVTRPNGVVSGAQCRYIITPGSDLDSPVEVREIRNGQVFDAAPPTASGCASIQPGIVPAAVFRVQCTAASPVTIRAEWTSGQTPGVTLAGVSQGYYRVTVGGQTSAFPINLVNGSSVACPENPEPENQRFFVGVGGAMTLDASAATTANALVGTVTLNATY